MSATGARFSVLALALALFMFGYVAWVGDRLTARAPALAAAPAPAVAGHRAGARGHRAGARGHLAGVRGRRLARRLRQAGQGRPYLAPRCAAMCKIAMGITMGYVLILML